MVDSGLRLLVLFPHLLACCIALGAILVSDARFLTKRGILDEHDRKSLNDLMRIATGALFALWSTGLIIIAIDFGHIPTASELLAQPKLLAKLSVVLILTLNGYLLHRYAMPVFTKKANFRELAKLRINFIFALGAISATSWIFAAFLGVARPLTPIFGYSGFMLAYVCVVLGAVCLSFLFVKHFFMPQLALTKDSSNRVRRKKGMRLAT